MGLAWDALDEGLPQAIDQIFANSAICPQQLFAFYLNDQTPDGSGGGEMTLCGIDPAHYVGAITYVPLIAQDYWRISLQSVSIGGQTVMSSPMSAILDTGTSLLTVPNAFINQINSIIGLKNDDNSIPCSSIASMPTMTLMIGGTPFTLTPNDYILKVSQGGQTYCFPGIEAIGDSESLWILGDVFIAKYYTIFDHANSRVGLALSSANSGGGQTTAGPTTGCADKASNCATNKAYCTNAAYASLMSAQCALTCGICVATSCADSSTQCAQWASAGFCTTTSYTTAEKIQYCQSTCKLCSSG